MPPTQFEDMQVLHNHYWTTAHEYTDIWHRYVDTHAYEFAFFPYSVCHNGSSRGQKSMEMECKEGFGHLPPATTTLSLV